MVDFDYDNNSHIPNFQKTFLGDCNGIGLSPRDASNGDLHVMFTPLTEDDGNWFPSGGSMSSAWLPEYIETAQTALHWLRNNAHKDPDGYGWIFKEKDRAPPMPEEEKKLLIYEARRECADLLSKEGLKEASQHIVNLLHGQNGRGDKDV